MDTKLHSRSMELVHERSMNGRPNTQSVHFIDFKTKVSQNM
jgi:hypothetical protein